MKTGGFLTFLVGNHLLLHPVLKDNSGKVKWGLGDCNCCDCDFFTPQVTNSNFFLPLTSAVFKMELHKIFYSSHFTLLSAGMKFWPYNPCITEMKISTILTHNIRRISLCGLFHLAEGQCCGTTDRSHTYEVRADIWLYPPLASLLKHTSAEHSELATEVTLKHTHTL